MVNISVFIGLVGQLCYRYRAACDLLISTRLLAGLPLIWISMDIYPWILRWHNTIALNLCKIPASFLLIAHF